MVEVKKSLQKGRFSPKDESASAAKEMKIDAGGCRTLIVQIIKLKIRLEAFKLTSFAVTI